MSEMLYKVPKNWLARAYVDDAGYRDMYARSVRDPEGFWASTVSASTGSSPIRG